MATTEHPAEFTVEVSPVVRRDAVALTDDQRAEIGRMAEQMLLQETQRFLAGKRLADYLSDDRLQQLLGPLGRILEIASDRLEKRPQ